jgi:hypothetical protein
VVVSDGLKSGQWFDGNLLNLVVAAALGGLIAAFTKTPKQAQ